MRVLTRHVNGAILWANLHLLFWLAPLPTACYGVVLLLNALAYTLLQTVIIRSQGEGSPLKRAASGDRKGKMSLVLYATAIPLAFVHEAVSQAIYVIVALIWLVPDRRIETAIDAHLVDPGHGQRQV